MSQIHPSSVIDPSAELGDVEVGPFCLIGPGVKLGDGSVLRNHVTIEGPSQIGKENIFYPGSVIGSRTQDLKYHGEPTFLKIGDNNTFRECATVHRSDDAERCTTIGSHGNFLAYSHIAHDCIVGDHVIFSNNGTLAGHVTVDDYAIVGGLTAIHQFCRIGRHAILGGCTKIVQDVPPFTIADGNPAAIRGINRIGLERHGFEKDAIRALREAYKILYRRELNLTPALQTIRDEVGEDHSEVTELLTFIETSERGIIR